MNVDVAQVHADALVERPWYRAERFWELSLGQLIVTNVEID